MAKIIISKLNLNTQPGVNQTATIKYRVQGAANWTLASAAVVVLPTGFLQTPLEIGGLLDNTVYDVWGYNNCGGQGTIVQFQTSQGGAGVITFQNMLTVGTILQILVDGLNVLNNPIAAGGFFQYDITGLGIGNHTIEYVLGGVDNGTVVHKRLARGQSLLQQGYITYNGGSTNGVYNGGVQSGDTLIIRTADAHTNVANYVPAEGPITGVCTINGAFISRTQQAIDDSVATAQSVRVSATWNADNAGSIDTTSDFVPGAATAGANGTIPGGPCASVIGSVTQVQII
jgi:hypothetical protein